MDDTDRDAEMERLIAQAEELCDLHDHILRVIAHLDHPEAPFSDDYTSPHRSDFTFESVVRMFLYQHVNDYTPTELARRMRGTAVVYLRFDLPRAPTQQAIHHMWRNRFTRADRTRLRQLAAEIRTLAAERGIISDDAPRLEPDEIDDESVGDEQIMDAVRTACQYGFIFDSGRADNATYSDEAFFERQGYITMGDRSTSTAQRRYTRLSHRSKTPHGDTHLRTMKKVATPPEQTHLDEFLPGDEVPMWKRIRDAVLEPFHESVAQQVEQVRERGGFKEPVIAAVDTTFWPFYASPYKRRSEITIDDDPTVVDDRRAYFKSDFPEMVSGYKDGQNGFKMATLTIVAENTPIILAVEPVRDQRWWEDDDDVSPTSRGEIVDRLLEQAEQHVEIHKLLADKEFASMEVQDVIDRRGIQYIMPRPERGKDEVGIEELREEGVIDVGVERSSLGYEGRTHEMSFAYNPYYDKKAERLEYNVFLTNEHVTPERAEQLVAQYRHRWEIENEYKTIKTHFLPKVASKDYRIRFLYFTLGCLLYNVWRLTNLVFREAVSVNLGEMPPIPAGELVEIIGFPNDPGG